MTLPGLRVSVRCLKPENCDPSLNSLFREGILGPVGMFPWLGVIRVELPYKVKHVGQTPCIQWYYREGLITRNDPWRAYQCVSTENNKKSCLFETGMILASNATGTWTLVESKRRSKAQLWYNYGSFIDTLEGVDETPKRVVKKYPVPARTTAEPDQESGQENSARSATEASKRFGRRIIENSRRYKKLISDSVINELLAIKNELETTRKELNITGKADINKTFKKMFAVKDKLVNVRDKLGSPAPDSLKNSIDVLDKTASELRAGQVFYQGKLMDVRKQEVQQSIDLIKEFRETPEYIEIALTTDKPEVKVEETIKKPKAKGRQGKKKPWKPHKFLEPEYITDKPGWWLYHPHLNLEFDFQFDDEAELSLEIWSHLTKIHGTRAPKTKPTRTRNYTDELDWEESRRVYADGEVEQNDAENEVEQNQEENLNDQQPSKSQDQERTGTEYVNDVLEKEVHKVQYVQQSKCMAWYATKGVNAGTRSNATLWYNYGDYIEPLEGSETPKELLKKYPLPTRDEEIENQSTTSKSSTTTTEKSRGDHNSNTTPENPGEDKNPNNTPGNPEKDKNSNKSPEQTQEGDDKSPEDRNKNAVPNASRQNHHRHTRRIINSNRRYKKLISDSLINDLQAIKGELETTKIELNIAGKADINKTFKKMLAIKNQLKKVQDKLGSHVSASLKDSINILDKAASELRAGQVFYEEKLMDIRKQEIQQSIDLIKEFREQPDIVKKKIQRKKETFKKPRPRGRQGNKKSWKPHKHLEKQYITDRPGWWLYYPHLNLELDFNFDEEAEMTIEIWSHRKVSSPTKGPKVELFTRTRTAPPNTMPVEITMNYLIAKIDPDKLPPRLSLENAKSLFKEIFPEKVPGNTTLETLPSFIDSEKLPLDIDLTNATDLVLMIFNGLLPASSLRQKIDDTVRYTGSLKSVLRKDSKFERYSELKRVKYYDDIIKTRGIDFFDDNQPDKSDINRSDRSFVVVIVIYVLLSNLDII
ncbi:hypothetical protein MSG28_012817 [Choristoneura fumiferana]|uniref:Uncharacterized protein n=1 Tax=Choristoneura fumiferana TaxID=7141 RepID=A0ACC0JI27_CHOFU|nr:hypothetical protein MSG28_012817 [Choristoneura fumiferana]